MYQDRVLPPETSGTIFVYADSKTFLRAPYVLNALRDGFGKTSSIKPAEIIQKNCDAFFQTLMKKNPNVVIIPENYDEYSRHMRDFSRDYIDILDRYVERGGTAVLFGGASHYMMSEIIWYWDNGAITYKGPKETFAKINGTLTGPHHRYPLSSATEINHQGCFQIPIRVPDKNGRIHREKCWQGLCGAFEIADGRTLERTRILATYDEPEIRQQGIAAMEIFHGDKGGSYILCSILPHYKPRSESLLCDTIFKLIESKMTRSSAPSMLQSPT